MLEGTRRVFSPLLMNLFCPAFAIIVYIEGIGHIQSLRDVF